MSVSVAIVERVDDELVAAFARLVPQLSRLRLPPVGADCAEIVA